MNIARLPPYPPTPARQQLPASQLFSLYKIIASRLSVHVGLPPAKRDTDSCRIYIQSYARDASLQVLQSLIWGPQDTHRISSDEELIRKYTLLLAEKVSPSLDLQTLLDLTIGYSTFKGHKKKSKDVLSAAAEAGETIHDVIEKEFVPALTDILFPQSPSHQSQGLYDIRKAAHCIISFLRVSPVSFIRHFAHSKDFILAVAHAYNNSLSSIATSYGGINVLRNAMNRPPGGEVDDWERMWVETKVALIDAFHILITRLVEDMSSAQGPSLAIEAERTFDIVFALLERSTSSSSASSGNSIPPTPFLNQPLLADYQQSYSLSHTLASALKHAEEKDARLDILESALIGFAPDGSGRKEPGALKIVLRSYGIQQGIDNLGKSNRHQIPRVANASSSSNQSIPPVISLSSNKGKAKAVELAEDPELDIKITQVLDVLPDLSSDYVKLLLGSDIYKGDLERVLGALLEGTAPSEEALRQESDGGGLPPQISVTAGSYDLSERHNVFDDQDMDLSRVAMGKKADDNDFLKDRSFINQMKADILRRAETIFNEEDEEDESIDTPPNGISPAGPSERTVFSPEDELDELEALKIRVVGDGEETDESDDPEQGDEEEEQMTPEAILELAWLRDAKLFDRDAATRRGEARARLRKDTGWVDEQIEGWKLMLDRNPKMQERIKRKHEFSGNQPSIHVPGPSRNEQGGSRGRGRGRGRGGRGGGAKRGGGGQGPSSGDSNTVRERSLKDKHKASRGNHNRKRGHDKKMSRAGAGVPPST